MFSIGTIINGNYHILSTLGEGGMGAVFKAFDERQARQVALKFLQREFSHDSAGVSRFRQEGEILATIRHPRVVEVYALETDMKTGLPFMVMECFPGRSLMDFQDELARNPTRLIRMFLDLLDGMKAVHAKKIIHRDLKPSNILINDAGDLKIVDFGIAKGSKKQTQTGIALGTPHYMSPEQCEGRPNITYRSDIYSLGIVLWELVMGTPPFIAPEDTSDAFLAIVMQHLTAPVPIDLLQENQIGRLFSEILLRMLDKNPEKRPEIDDVIQTLQSVKETLLKRSNALSMRFPLGPLVQKGPFGEFYQAWDTKTDTRVLVQIVRGTVAQPETAVSERLKRLAEIRHPGVCEIVLHQTDRRDGRRLMAMELPAGRPLDQVEDTFAKNHDALSLFMLNVLEALSAIHERGDVHGNLQPAFIMIGEKNEPRIGGFPMYPVAQVSREKAGSEGVYVAPEQWKGGPVTAASDIYSAGLIFWELIFGRLPSGLTGTKDMSHSRSGRGTDDTISLRALTPQDPLFPFLEHLMGMTRGEPEHRPALAPLLACLREIRAAFERSAPKTDQKGDTRQCLLLTKDETLATLVGLTMKEFGFRFQRAWSYREVARLTNAEPTVAWFIDLDGFQESMPEIATLGMKEAPEVKIVFLATSFTRELAEECMGQLANGILVKPLSVPRLVQTLSSLNEEPEIVENEYLFPLRPVVADACGSEQQGNPYHVLFFECGVCRERFGTQQLKPGTVEFHTADTDFCPVCKEGIVPETYAIIVCPSCLYANFAGRFQRAVFLPETITRFLEKSELEERIKAAHDLDFQNERTLTEGVRSFDLAALCAKELEPLEYDRLAAGIYLKASWMCRRLGKSLMETDYQTRALECIMRLYHPYLSLSKRFTSWESVREKLRPGQELLGERAVVVNGFLGAELSARLELDEQAEFYFDKVLALSFLSRFPLLARHIHAAHRKFKNRRKDPTGTVL